MTAENENELQQINKQHIEQENMEEDNYQSEEDNVDNEEYQHQQHDVDDNQNTNPELRRSTRKRDVPTRTGIFNLATSRARKITKTNPKVANISDKN